MGGQLSIVFTCPSSASLEFLNYQYYILVFPPAPKKGMVRFSKKGTFNVQRHAMRALLSARRHAKRALKMNLFIYLQSKSLIVITVLFYMLPADL